MIQRAVVDSNMLQSPCLRAWLAHSSSNAVVLPEYVWLEIYKQQTVASLVSAVRVIQDFSDQVAVLRPCGKLGRMDPSHPEFVEQMLRAGVADEMRMMVEAIVLARQGEPAVVVRLQEKWASAAAHMDTIQEGTIAIVESLPDIAEIFTQDEIRRCRTHTRYTTAMFEKTFGAADQLYEIFLELHEGTPVPHSDEHRYDAYFYRQGLAVIIYALWWIRSGSQIPKRLDRARNDFIDLWLAVYGTYFAGRIVRRNGCMTTWSAHCG